MILYVCFQRMVMLFSLKKIGFEKNPETHATPELKDTNEYFLLVLLRQLLNKKNERRCRPKIECRLL